MTVVSFEKERSSNWERAGNILFLDPEVITQVYFLKFYQAVQLCSMHFSECVIIQNLIKNKILWNINSAYNSKIIKVIHISDHKIMKNFIYYSTLKII
jgi:hypothetical protein